MLKYTTMEVQDDYLWKLAKKRASFKKHLATYLIINGFLWAIWLFDQGGGYPWPMWVTLGWGLGLAFNYVSVYLFEGKDLHKKEYENLKKERGIN